MVQRVEGKIAARASPAGEAPPAPPPPPVEPDRPDTTPPTPLAAMAGASPAAASGEPALVQPKVIQPLSPSLMAEAARLRVVDDTLPPTSHQRLVATVPIPPSAVEPPPGARGVFRALEKGLMEVDFSGKVFLKLGTIYSYSGNLTFWVKERRPGGRPTLVIATGEGRLILTDGEREITFMQVEEPVFVESNHLLACEEGLQPRYVRLGEAEGAVEVVALEGQGMLALSVASKPLPLTVRPGLPVSVPAHSVIMWTGRLTPHVVDDPQVYEVVLASSATGGRLLRLEGTGRILVEQATP
jgi:uncharacterized protein (AIM24 family)